MRCEVCGRRIVGKPFKAIIEGAKMMVCGECVKLGSIYWEAKTPQSMKRVAGPPSKILRKKPPPAPPTVTETLELVDDFSSRVRQAREKLGLSHEDFGRRIREKVSVLRKIETGKMTPDHKLADKLEHALKVKLLVPVSEPRPPPMGLSPAREATIRDVVHLKKGKMEVAEERKPS